MYQLYDDRQLVEAILSNDRGAKEYFLTKKCSKILEYIVWNVFDGKIEANELLSEFFLYLAKDDWDKLRKFDFRSKLTTWLSVVAVRFFQKNRVRLIEKTSTQAQINNCADDTYDPHGIWESEYDLDSAIKKMSNERYREVIRLMDLEGYLPEEVAEKLNVSMANLYNIRHRAHAQLAFILKGAKK